MNKALPFRMGKNDFGRYSKRLLRIALRFFWEAAMEVGSVEQAALAQMSPAAEDNPPTVRSVLAPY
jgi:hypothetical protein